MFSPNPTLKQIAQINLMTEDGKSSKEISQVLEIIEESVVRFMNEYKKTKPKGIVPKGKEGE